MKKLMCAADSGGFFVSDDCEEVRADRREEVERMRDEGYSPAEIAALLSTDRWAGYSSQ